MSGYYNTSMGPSDAMCSLCIYIMVVEQVPEIQFLGLVLGISHISQHNWHALHFVKSPSKNGKILIKYEEKPSLELLEPEPTRPFDLFCQNIPTPTRPFWHFRKLIRYIL